MEIVYLDKDWNPVTRERADFAKIFQDDGSIVFAYPKKKKDYHLPGEHDQCDHSVTGECTSKETSPARQKLFDAEARIRGNKEFETAFAVKPDGEVVLDKRGDARSVTFTIEELETFTDTVFTHNHPSGNGLSASDLHLAAWANMAEIRAVGYIGGATERRPDRPGVFMTYIMKRPEGGWPHPEDARTIASKFADVTRSRLQRRVDDDRLTGDEAEAAHWAVVNALYAKKIGAEFRVIRVKEKK